MPAFLALATLFAFGLAAMVIAGHLAATVNGGPAGVDQASSAEQGLGASSFGKPAGKPTKVVGSSGQPRRTARVLVVYYSRSGNTLKMAEAVVEGARSVPGTEVLLREVTTVNKEDLNWADAIALGCPTYFANIPGIMKECLDQWNWKWKVDFTDKIGGAFATGGGQMGGKEHAMVSLLLFMLSNRMMVAGPLFEDETGEDIWGEPGAGAMTGPLDPGVSEKELESGHRLGQRLATLAVRWIGSAQL